MTLQEIKDYAATLDLVFSDWDAQDVLDTKPLWYTEHEIVKEAVDDYINAFGS
jgi:hypothetical protein